MFFNNVLAEDIGISVLYFFDSYTLRKSDDLFNCYYGRQRLFPTHTCARSLTKIDGFWRGLADFGRNILAHVNISYDGAKGSLHIDIVPTETQALDNESSHMIEGINDQQLLKGKKKKKSE